MDKTTNLALNAPTYNDPLDVKPISDNFKTIDGKWKDHDDKIGNLSNYYVTQISGAVTINIPTANDYTVNNAKLLSFVNANPNVEVYFPAGTYHLQSGIQFLYGVSLRLHRNAEIKADNTMDYMFDFNNSNQSPGALSTFIRHQYITGGTFNGNDKAGTIIKMSKYQDFIISYSTIKNFLKKGILTEESSAELKLNTIYLCNDNCLTGTVDNVTDNVALDIQSTDNYIHNVTIVDVSVGVRVGQAGNYVDKVHYWTSQGTRIPYTIAFDVQDGAWAKFSYCVSDTAQIGFRNAQYMHLDHCEILNNNFYSSYYSPSTPTAISLTAGYDAVHVNHTTFEGSSMAVNVLDTDYNRTDFKNRFHDNTYWGTCNNKPLSDYETAVISWTPSLVGSTTAGTPTYTTRTALYSRSGKIISYQAVIKATMDSTIAGNLIITGLPYTPYSGVYAVSIGYRNNLGQVVVGEVVSGGSQVNLYTVDNTGAITAITGSSVQTKVVEIHISGTYMMA